MSQIFQTSYSQTPDLAVPGQLSDAFAPRNVSAKVARGLIKAGYGVFKTANGGAGSQMMDPGECYHIPSPVAAADVDAVITAYTTSTGVQTFTGAQLNGLVGTSEMQPPRKFTGTLSNHADWDATNLTLIGYNHEGVYTTETIAIPNGGNGTITSTNRYRSFVSVSIPAQSGTGGTATFGVAAIDTVVVADLFGVAVRQMIKTTIATAGIYGYPGNLLASTTADYVDGEVVPVLSTGGIWVFTEEAVSDRDPVYVRVTSGAGGSVVGAFRNDDDTSSCELVPGAKFVRDCASGVALAKFAY